MGIDGVGIAELLFLILGLAIGLVLGARSNRRSARATTDLAVASAAPPALYRVDSLEIFLKFDEDGSGTFVRRERGIAPISDLQEVVVPYRFSVTPPGSLDPPEIHSFSERVSASWQPSTVEPDRTEGVLRIRGQLHAGDSEAGYEINQRFRRAFCMTKEETLKAYSDSAMKQEYLGVVAYVPTRILRFRVEFPESHKKLSSGPNAIAFIGETESENENETARIKSSFRHEPGVASLELENPRRGIRYAITWLAPPRG